MRRSVEQGSDARARTRDDDAVGRPASLGQIPIRDQFITPARRNDNVESCGGTRARELRRRTTVNAATTASLPTMTAALGPPARGRASVRAESLAGASLSLCIHATISAHTVGKLHPRSG
jgi:hypothetical protein